MDLQDYLNVRRVLRQMAKETDCPVLVLKAGIKNTIDRSWEKAQTSPEEKVLWDHYFPDGKPSPEAYILWLGHAYENGEQVPYLLKDEKTSGQCH